METARQLGMKVMLSFADNWKYSGELLTLLEQDHRFKAEKQRN